MRGVSSKEACARELRIKCEPEEKRREERGEAKKTKQAGRRTRGKQWNSADEAFSRSIKLLLALYIP